jgi:uncharacterized protein (TIGR03435 family)
MLTIVSRYSQWILLSSTMLVAAPSAAQLAHLGPAGIIKLSQTLPPYDVSSVKINDSGEGNFSMSLSDTNGTLVATNVPVETLIEFAYDVKSDHIFGLSGPVKDAHFDVQAKVILKDDGRSTKLTDQQLQAMMIPLLAERFRLKAHVESRTLPIYELVVLHGGPKVKLSTEAAHSSSINMSANNTDRILSAKAASMADLAQALSDLVHRQVVDKTGASGRADITLKWTDDEAVDQGGAVLSIFTALQEQLGFKLVSSKGPVDTLVIDHIEMPTEN